MHPRRSLGFLRKMKLIQRRVHGFGNFNNHRLRVTAQCGWLIPTSNRQMLKSKKLHKFVILAPVQKQLVRVLMKMPHPLTLQH